MIVEKRRCRCVVVCERVNSDRGTAGSSKLPAFQATVASARFRASGRA
jgi:hypothetical protein